MAEHHQCTRLTGCTYFESLIQKGTDALTIGSELRKLFCGFDGFDIMVIHSYLFIIILFIKLSVDCLRIMNCFSV